MGLLEHEDKKKYKYLGKNLVSNENNYDFHNLHVTGYF